VSKPISDEMMRLLVSVFNSGYMRGHCETVDGEFTPVNPLDWEDYHRDLVEEIMEERLK
jgi:hypothetical protein